MKDSTTDRLVDEVAYTLISVFTKVYTDAVAYNKLLVCLYKELISSDDFADISIASDIPGEHLWT